MRNLHCGMFGAAFALVVCASPVQAQPYGYGMMGGYGPGWMMGPGMMGGYGPATTWVGVADLVGIVPPSVAAMAPA
jgi:hypothetical protein